MIERCAKPVIRSIRCVVLLAILLAGCAAPLSVEQVDFQTAYLRLNRSALSEDRLSETTRTALRRYGLLDSLQPWPDQTIASLRARVVHDPDAWPELYALAELSYLRGRRTGSQEQYLAAAVYAYAYLFPDNVPAGDRPDPFDPRFRQASDLYNFALTAAMTQEPGGVAVFRSGRYALPFGVLDISVDEDTFSSGGRSLTSFRPTIDLEVKGLNNQFRTPGIGAPMAASAAPPRTPVQGIQIAPRLRIPTTAVLTIPDPRRQLATGTLHGTLAIHTIFSSPTISLAGLTVPLETHPSAARAYSLTETQPWSNELRAFLFGDLFDKEQDTKLAALEPHRKGRMPIVLIHGTASSPFRWADLVNDLDEDDRIRNNYEFWLFTYATGSPVPWSALLLRDSLNAAIAQLGGAAADPALGRMVLIGHSQGGLLARLLTVDAGSKLWDALSRKPLDQLQLRPETRDILRRGLFVEHMPEVERVIFMATPHRGSFLTEFSPVRMLARIITLPAAIAKITAETLTGNAAAFRFDTVSARTGSLFGMTPTNPWMQVLARLPTAPGIHAHSIIPTLGNGPLESRSDGVVRYTSAHLEGVDSELIVQSGHSVQSNPAAIEEIRRILLLQLAEHRRPGSATVVSVAD